MQDAWYYATPEEQIGPVTLQELKETLPTLPNPKDVYIWHDSLPEWIRAGDLAEIVAQASGRPLEAETRDNSDNPNSHDGTTDTKRDLASLEDLHPDRTYAITMPTSPREETATAAITGKRNSIVGLMVGAVLVLLGCGLVYVGFMVALPWVTNVFGGTGALLLVVGLFLILFRRHKATAR